MGAQSDVFKNAFCPTTHQNQSQEKAANHHMSKAGKQIFDNLALTGKISRPKW